jgi:phosphoglucomutase
VSIQDSNFFKLIYMNTEEIREKALVWTGPGYDEETRKSVMDLLEGDTEALTEAFYQDLEFGTGGLRGIMGPGTNRMNRYTVSAATQGLSNYLKKYFSNEISVVIAHDSRNNSRFFAEVTAAVFSANGIKVWLFPEMRPTPLLSFAIRELHSQAGIVITASHNPAEYNGYKVYWQDGGQLVSPQDKEIIAEVRAVKGIADIKMTADTSLIQEVSTEVEEAYLKALQTVSLQPDIIKKYHDLKILFTPLHGTGITLVPKALQRFGFTAVSIVEEQAVPDGNFPTTPSPNPEEREALKMALEKAAEINADLIFATDPDADRLGVAVKDVKGGYMLLNGNQTASILTYYLLNEWKRLGRLQGKEYIVKTIVTTELLKAMADTFGIECYDVLTGFKYIAEIIKQKEGRMKFIGGGEESYGFLAGDFVRDKDAVMTAALFAEAYCMAASENKTVPDILMEIYKTWGFYHESLLSITRKGIRGAEEIRTMMDSYRNYPPDMLAGSRVLILKDYKAKSFRNLISKEDSDSGLPASDVLQFLTEDGSIVTVRPSGTEPKIKFYFGVKMNMESDDTLETLGEKAGEKIKSMMAGLNL